MKFLKTNLENSLDFLMSLQYKILTLPNEFLVNKSYFNIGNFSFDNKELQTTKADFIKNSIISFF